MADKTLTMNMSINNFKKFISYSKELSLIDPTIILSISDDIIVTYSFVGKDINDIHAFKTVITDTEDLFDKRKTIENKIVFIIKDSKKFVRNISNFIDFDEELKFKISYDDQDFNANYIQISNSKLKLKEICGDPILMSKEITKEDIDFLTNKNNALLNFSLSEMEFRKIKRMSTIETTNDILYITINNGELSMGENKWDLKICDLDKPNIHVSFPKKYFNTLSFKENTKIYLFENYILVSDDNSDLMIVLEMTI